LNVQRRKFPTDTARHSACQWSWPQSEKSESKKEKLMFLAITLKLIAIKKRIGGKKRLIS